MLCKLSHVLAPARCRAAARPRTCQLGSTGVPSLAGSQANSVSRRLANQTQKTCAVTCGTMADSGTRGFANQARDASAADYEGMTNEKLTELLGARKKSLGMPDLKVSGLKAELIERLRKTDSLEKAHLLGTEQSEPQSSDADRNLDTQTFLRPATESALPSIDRPPSSDGSAEAEIPINSEPDACQLSRPVAPPSQQVQAGSMTVTADAETSDRTMQEVEKQKGEAKAGDTGIAAQAKPLTLHTKINKRDPCEALISVGSFRQTAHLDGITVVTDAESADRALRELERLKDRPHAWDTETADVSLGRSHNSQSPVNHGRAVCATCYCGDDADFGSGPRLLVDNAGPAAGLLESKFKSYFEDASYQKVFHNYSFDRHVLARHNIRVQGLHADTIHLARVYDTSLSSWEGREQARASADAETTSEALQQGLSRGSTSPADSATPTSRNVLAVRLGGMPLEKQAWSATAGLHTTALPSEEALASVARAPKKMGYSLKSLSSHYNLVEDRQPTFPELFGVHELAAAKAHDSPEHFAQWAQYATNDAKLTYRLFEKLSKALEERPWCTAVHEKPIGALLGDTAVADELLRRKPFFKMGKLSSNAKSPNSYGSVQTATGQNMWNLFEEYLRDFAECLADLEEAGVAVDLDILREVEAQAEQDEVKERIAFADSFGTMRGFQGELLNPDADKINPRSSQQLQSLLFGGSIINPADGSKLKLEATRDFPIPKETVRAAGAPRSKTFELKSIGLSPSAKKKDFTGTGLPKTSKDVLRRLAADLGGGKTQGLCSDEARKASQGLLSLRSANQASRILTGFARPLQNRVSAAGRIHPSWKFETSTGRLACREPNLQNLPSSGTDKYGIRKAFRAGPGNVFVIADYSQLELRVLAHMSKCPIMIKNLTEGGDFHSEVAAELYPHIRKEINNGNVATVAGGTIPSVKSIFPKERSSAKAINFGIIYGMTAGSLAEDLNISKDQAEKLMDKWLDAKPTVRRWLREVKAQSQQTQRSLSLLGRWRNFPLLDDRASHFYKWRSLRAAVNFGIQGSAADIVLAAMLRLWKNAELEKLGFRMVMQVHDEIVLEGPEANAEEAKRIVEKAMMNPFEEKNPDFIFMVPLEVDIGVRQSFAAA